MKAVLAAVFLGSGARHLAVDDYINFQVNGGRRFVVRVMAVHKYASFDAMISALGVDSLLPDFRGSVAAWCRRGC